MLNYQEKKSIELEEPQGALFATIGEVLSDGITLIFDGQTEASQKHYKCNTAITFTSGQRVKVAKGGGTYLVEYPIGNPKI